MCQKCPLGTYKSTMDNEECIECPCVESVNFRTGLTKVDQCKCRAEISDRISFLQVFSIFMCFCVAMLFLFLVMQRNKKYIEKNYLSDLRYKVKDIPDGEGRILVQGSNTPNSPWVI